MSIAQVAVALKGRDETGAAFKSIVRNAETAQKTIATKLKAAFSVITGGAIGHTIASWNRMAIDNAKSMGLMAESFGATAAEASRLDFAARNFSMTIEQLAPGLTKFQKELGKSSDESNKTAQELANLNLDASVLMRMPLSRQLGEIADAFGKVQNPAERLRIATQLFGDEVGRKFIPILASGKEGLRAFGEESDRLGNTLTNEVLQKLEATDAVFKKLEASSLVLKRELAVRENRTRRGGRICC